MGFEAGSGSSSSGREVPGSWSSSSLQAESIVLFFGQDLKRAIEGPGTGLRREPSPKPTTLVPNFQHHVNFESRDSRLFENPITLVPNFQHHVNWESRDSRLQLAVEEVSGSILGSGHGL